MEKIPAACAMEWSIELEKNIRSKKQGKCVEAILQFGPRLEWWNRETTIRKAEYNMFSLVAGEDELFANTILLRLVEAFRLGDRITKLCVVKVFLSELRCRRKSMTKKSISKKDGGFLLSKGKVENQVEFLRRAKMVFDGSGDAEERAMALVLFGCWANFARDSAEIRYVVLSSLVSSNALEVKAALFAAECFCELSHDFASVFLEILINMVTSSETLMAVRLAGVRALSKMGCLASIANRAYKTGLNLVLDSTEEDLIIKMLVSLSKIASRSTLLVPRQIELLFSFLTTEKTLHLQVMSLRCLNFIYARGMHFHASTESIKTLFGMLDEVKCPPVMEPEVLSLLHKILLYTLSTNSSMDVLEFSKLLTIVENEIKSSIMSKRLLAIRVLVDKFGKLERTTKALDGVASSLASRLILFIIDRTSLLVEQMLNHCINLEIKQEVKSLLSLLLVLVEGNPYFSGFVLEKICLCTKNMLDGVVGTMEDSSHDTMEFGETKIFISSKIMLFVSRIVTTCLGNLTEVGDITFQSLQIAKSLVEQVHQHCFLDSYTSTVYLLLLHPEISAYRVCNEKEQMNNVAKDWGISLHDYCIHNEVLSVECVKNIFEKNDYWFVYKAGKYAACQGAWFTAAFIFEHIMTRVQSSSCCCWIKSLAQLARSENKVQLLVLPKQPLNIVKWMEDNNVPVIHFGDDLGDRSKNTSWKFNLPVYIHNLLEVCNTLRSSTETIKFSYMGYAFSFQRWFLDLRVKTMENVVDLLKLLAEVPHGEVTSLVYPLTRISSRLKRVAHELDLILTSFAGMDSQSLMIISVLSLSCSLLAFCTGFSLFIPYLDNFRISIVEYSEDQLHVALIQDLCGRLWHADNETSNKLGSFFKFNDQPKGRFLPPSRNQLNISCEGKGVLKMCRFAITGMIYLQNKAKGVHDIGSISQFTDDGLHLLWDIVVKWMQIPFRTPARFFQFRPCISSELFVSQGDAGTSDELSISSGSHLSLNVCLQLKNLQQLPPLRPKKLYCILYSTPSFQIPCPNGNEKGQTEANFCHFRTDYDMITMNDKLWNYVMGRTMSKTAHIHENEVDFGAVDAFVSFEPNCKRQGFSTCLLDVSKFPLGSYRIKWRSCFVDDEGSYWSPLPLNDGPFFTVK